MTVTLESLRARFAAAGQGHLFAGLAELDGPLRERYLRSLEALDLSLVLQHAALVARPSEPQHATRFAPAPVFPLERDAKLHALASRATAAGAERMSRGEVGFLVVAGGQASRLGYDGPKGMFPVAPVSRRTLFDLFARKIAAAARRHGFTPAWYVLTSQANHDATQEYFERQRWFGLGAENIVLFRQAMVPALDPQGRILLAGEGELFLAPTGHGGVLSALADSGALAAARARGIRVFSYFQVDNPLAPPADALFLGLHTLERAAMSSKIVRKRNPHEKVGVLGLADGRLTCIEYSDLPPALREARDAAGELTFGAGSIALHAIELEFVERLTSGGLRLPWHVARKSMRVVSPEGQLVQREGCKFETFVFDALEFAEHSIVLEVDRAQEFSPIKNASGEDSPATARADLCRLFAGWARRAGAPLPPAGPDGIVAIEIDPLFADDEQSFRAGLPAAPRVLPEGHLYA